MKVSAIIVALMLWAIIPATAQTTPTPEFKNKVMMLKDNILSELERTDMRSSLSTSPMTGRSEISIVANGKTANLKLTGSKEDTYIVKIDPDTDPASTVELFKFDESKKERKLLVGKMSLGKDQHVELTKIKISFKKVSDGVYTITADDKLSDGQYGFIVARPIITGMSAANGQALVGYCFAVGS